MLFEDLIKNTPYDMEEIKVRVVGVFRVLESREKLSKKVIAISIEKVAPEQVKGVILRAAHAGIKGRKMTEEVIIASLGRILRLMSPTLS